MTSPADRVLIHHPDGRSYSVTRKAFESLYQAEGFEIGEAESEAAFIANVPAPASRAGARRKTRKPANPAERPK